MWVIVAVFLVSGQAVVTNDAKPFETFEACEEKREKLEASKPDDVIGNSVCVEIFKGQRFEI